MKVLITVIYLVIMLTSSSCRKIGVIIRIFDNSNVVSFTKLTNWGEKYLTCLEKSPTGTKELLCTVGAFRSGLSSLETYCVVI